MKKNWGKITNINKYRNENKELSLVDRILIKENGNPIPKNIRVKDLTKKQKEILKINDKNPKLNRTLTKGKNIKTRDPFELYIKDSKYDNYELIKRNLRTGKKTLLEVGNYDEEYYLDDFKEKEYQDLKKRGHKVYKDYGY